MTLNTNSELGNRTIRHHAGGHVHGVPVGGQVVQLQQLEGAGVVGRREPAAPARVARLRRQRLHREPTRERAPRTRQHVLVADVHVV